MSFKYDITKSDKSLKLQLYEKKKHIEIIVDLAVFECYEMSELRNALKYGIDFGDAPYKVCIFGGTITIDVYNCTFSMQSNYESEHMTKIRCTFKISECKDALLEFLSAIEEAKEDSEYC